MITSELKDGIVWITVDGEMRADEMKREISKWLPQVNTFSGFITDLRKMSGIPSMEEQKALEAWRKNNKTGKPHAMLGEDNILNLMIQVYVQFTKAADTRYFMNPYAAIAWIETFRK